MLLFYIFGGIWGKEKKSQTHKKIFPGAQNFFNLISLSKMVIMNWVLKIRNFSAIALFPLITGSQAMAQRQMEKLDRGVIAVHNTNDSVYIGWRLSGTEPDEIAFNIYRQSGNEKPVRLNKKPLKESTNYEDGNVNFKTNNSYFVKASIKRQRAGKKQILYSESQYTCTAIHQYSSQDSGWLYSERCFCGRSGW